ncbi:hypothetical protein CERSUDRAFT_97146 [Gelatoporia subvermispora B]|uniref:Uncharacterized protein n=1 Tax=Ceriporiopsis subvermispora (strain B) TaxID=914234 RepID=M2QQT8_CERS8|nr:hypothetical protein CERSUDRAFT_97146 [Gelatoporia subvermispora B]
MLAPRDTHTAAPPRGRHEHPPARRDQRPGLLAHQKPAYTAPLSQFPSPLRASHPRLFPLSALRSGPRLDDGHRRRKAAPAIPRPENHPGHTACSSHRRPPHPRTSCSPPSPSSSSHPPSPLPSPAPAPGPAPPRPRSRHTPYTAHRRAPRPASHTPIARLAPRILRAPAIASPPDPAPRTPPGPAPEIPPAHASPSPPSRRTPGPRPSHRCTIPRGRGRAHGRLRTVARVRSSRRKLQGNTRAVSGRVHLRSVRAMRCLASRLRDRLAQPGARRDSDSWADGRSSQPRCLSGRIPRRGRLPCSAGTDAWKNASSARLAGSAVSDGHSRDDPNRPLRGKRSVLLPRPRVQPCCPNASSQFPATVSTKPPRLGLVRIYSEARLWRRTHTTRAAPVARARSLLSICDTSAQMLLQARVCTVP